LPTNTGLDDFKQVVKEFRGLTILVVGGAAALPFAADLASFSPAWPKGIVVVTALGELVALMLVFQLFRSATKRRVNTLLITSASAVLLVSLVYLFALSLFTYEARTTHERFVKGFVCSFNAKKIYGTTVHSSDTTKSLRQNFQLNAFGQSLQLLWPG